MSSSNRSSPQTPTFSSDNRTSLLRASVFDAFAELGTFDENSQIAEWIFNPDVDVSSSLDSDTDTPRKGTERLGSDASHGHKGGSAGATRRSTKRFFGGLRSRSASRRREKQEKQDEGKKKPFLPFTRTKPERAQSPQAPVSSSLEIPRSPYALGHSANASVGTTSSWVNIQPSASLDLLRSPETSSNPFLGVGVPFPRERAISGGSPLFQKISSIVGRPPTEDYPAPEAALLPVRRTQSRPPEVTEAIQVRLAPNDTKIAISFSTPVHRQHATVHP
ncbi:hypothetical protein BDP27DRAFT_1342654 [Rhodocollybia butyracea]|uniref:Uncharacterized protein n=1 Tax=Rhodocollybia butyracea TaxID=206335 RepID=A0A9P5P965_9AGAR|nr:hypothetical protein BDP27DRAFT_1342654 [Rhodocollybia butyracea]